VASKYEGVIQKVFLDGYRAGARRVGFTRRCLVDAHDALHLPAAKNIGDIIYAFRFRRDLPEAIRATAPEGAEWIITLEGRARYAFRLASPGKILPTAGLEPIPIPDATPGIVRQYAQGRDEQALLTRARYNRLIDLFNGLCCYSIQSHLRTTVTDFGQIEVDEIYVGLQADGRQVVLPCQAKSPGDRFGIVQVMQDLALCAEVYQAADCKPIALQFTGHDQLTIMELAVTEDDDLLRLTVVQERAYRLVT
jgi:hypothetical protein